MASEQNKMKSGSKENIIRTNEDNIIAKLKFITFIPLIIILGIVPLITRLKIQEVPANLQSYALGDTYTDVFSYWKSGTVFVAVGIMLIILFFFKQKKDMKVDRIIKAVMIALGVYIVATLISTLLSEHKDLVWWGMYGVRQGFIILASYVAIAVYSLYSYKTSKDMKYIIIPLAVMVVAECIIIFSQFMGNDLMFSSLFKWLIIPAEYGDMGDKMVSVAGSKAFGTLYNPNYVGSFVALLLPIFTFLAVKEKRLKFRLSYIGLVVALLVSLVASESRAGIVGLGGCIIVVVILFARQWIKRPKIIAVSVLSILVAVFGLNIITGGVVVERLGSIISDSMSVFSSGESNILAEAPIQDVALDNNRLKISLIDGFELYMDISDSGDIILEDGRGEEVSYEIIDEKFYTPNLSVDTDISFQKGEMEYEGVSTVAYAFEWKESPLFIVEKIDGVMSTYDMYGKPTVIEKAESIGFAGMERIGSNRGYIWSRSLPILRDNLIFGTGPDSYMAEFPNSDIVVKNYIYGSNTLVDKPHNLFLQIGIQQGIIALGAFLFINGLYIISAMRLYMKKKVYTVHDFFGMGIMIGIVGYLVAGIFNDGAISVAPLYWCLLGIGLGVNYINKKVGEES